MSPLTFIQNPGLRLVLTISIILNLVLGGVNLFAIKFFADAMATSQINIVEKIAQLKNDVGNIKTDVHRELDSAVSDIQATNKEGRDRIKENQQNFEEARASGQALLDQMKELMGKADRTTAAANSATKAAKATHAKLNQKIVTGSEAEALKRAARKKTTVVKIWPWQ